MAPASWLNVVSVTENESFKVSGSNNGHVSANVCPWPIRAVNRILHCAHARKHLRVDEQAIAIDSDLSADMEIAAEELDAIARLLGDELKTFLSET